MYDADAQRRFGEYRELANSLYLWIREKMCLVQDRFFPSTLIEMKKIEADSNKLKNDDIPSRFRDKQKLTLIYRDLQMYFESIGERDLESELEIDNLDKSWTRLMILQEEREQIIDEEINRLKKLQLLAEKVHREMKACDNCLDELEKRVEEEAHQIEKIHPLEAKHAVDILEEDIRTCETKIKNIFTDIRSLTEVRYVHALELQKCVQKLHQRWVGLRSLLHKRLVQPLSDVSFPVEERIVTTHRTKVLETRLVDTNSYFRNLHDCIDWCKIRLKQITEANFGSDLSAVQSELEAQKLENKQLELFKNQVEKCFQAKTKFRGEELILYGQHLNQLDKIHLDLQVLSKKRTTDLETVFDFLQSATTELVWLNSKEEIELSRDWSDRNLNIRNLEQYYEVR